MLQAVHLFPLDAHLYLLRRILHDFYEPICVELVKNIASAMGATSRLLIGDSVMPEKANVGDDRMVYQMEFSMMVLTGQEKTAKQFERISEAAGLELVKIWHAPVGAQAIVEARLKSEQTYTGQQKFPGCHSSRCL